MTDFDEEQHRITGDATAAKTWIDDSVLPGEEKVALQRFVNRFPSLGFARDEDVLLEHFEQVGRIALPAWFRASRSTLAAVEPLSRLRMDVFTFEGSPREVPSKEFYGVEPGYTDEETRDLLFGEAGVYLIGQWWGTDHSCLAIDLEYPEDRRIFEFAMEDLLDDQIDGLPLRDSIQPVYSSYADMLGHVVDVRLPDGTIVSATS